jgi:ornithine carbamoyltransferase
MNIVSITDVRGELNALLEMARKFKGEARKGIYPERLKNKSLAMIFDKPSTRTRISFEVAMAQLGGHGIYLDTTSMQLRRGETIKDTALTLSRYVDAIIVRAGSHLDLVELAEYSRVPVINGLTDLEHPCQALSDLFTIKGYKGDFPGVKLAYVGDGNNVCHSLLLGAAMAGLDMSVASPRGYEPRKDILDKAKGIAKSTGSNIDVHRSASSAVKNADIIYTDVWVSMGQEAEKVRRLKDFKGYQVNRKLVEIANNPLIMHCLPAKRGQEITDEVLESENSIVFEQAENRLHLQKALLCHLISGELG